MRKTELKMRVFVFTILTAFVLWDAVCGPILLVECFEYTVHLPNSRLWTERFVPGSEVLAPESCCGPWDTGNKGGAAAAAASASSAGQPISYISKTHFSKSAYRKSQDLLPLVCKTELRTANRLGHLRPNLPWPLFACVPCALFEV